jgi:hypothetical protein
VSRSCRRALATVIDGRWKKGAAAAAGGRSGDSGRRCTEVGSEEKCEEARLRPAGGRRVFFFSISPTSNLGSNDHGLLYNTDRISKAPVRAVAYPVSNSLGRECYLLLSY